MIGWEKQLDCKAMIRLVEEASGIRASLILGKSRTAPIVTARHVLCHLLFWELELSCAEIGSLIGRDRTTVLASVRRVKEWRRDPLMAALLDKVRELK